MAIGAPTDPANLNGDITSLAQQWRDAALGSERLAAWVSKQPDDATVAAKFGIAETDVPQLRTDIGYLSTLAGVHNGTVQQGGSGGTGASLFNFGDALTVWAGP